MSSFNKSYTSGDVIEVGYFPHEEDKTGGEARWVICLEDLQNEMIAVPLKSNTSHQKDHPDSFIILQDSDEGKRMNLLNDSLVIPDRARRMPKVYGRKHGVCSEEFIDQLIKIVNI